MDVTVENGNEDMNGTTSMLSGVWPHRVTFEDGEEFTTFYLQLSNDSISNEGCRSVVLGLTSPSGGAIISTSQNTSVVLREEALYESQFLERTFSEASNVGGEVKRAKPKMLPVYAMIVLLQDSR